MFLVNLLDISFEPLFQLFELRVVPGLHVLELGLALLCFCLPVLGVLSIECLNLFSVLALHLVHIRRAR